MTKDDIIRMAREAGWKYADGENGYSPLWKFGELVAAAEREAIAQMIEDAPPLVQFAQNNQGGCLVCGFTPKLAASTIRARGQNEDA